MKNSNGILLRGDCFETIAKVKDASIQTVVTSPPYWQLRDYDLDEEKTSGEFGREKTLQEYINKVVLLFEQIKRVLRHDGTVWLNLGDCYNVMGTEGGHDLKPLDLIAIPWKTALHLRNAGWYLRSDIIWSKPNFMPINTANRPVSSHEHIFLFTKNKKYYYDQYSILSPRGTFPKDVWRIGNKKERNLQHYATFPVELPVKCIKAGTSEFGSCAKCGAPYKRKMKKIIRENKRTMQSETDKGRIRNTLPPASSTANFSGVSYRETIGWEKTCKCKTKKVKPCRVLDPFMGSGTTAVAAELLHRRWVGLELYKSNCNIIKNRVQATVTGADYMKPEKKKLVKKIGFGLSKRT